MKEPPPSSRGGRKIFFEIFNAQREIAHGLWLYRAQRDGARGNGAKVKRGKRDRNGRDGSFWNSNGQKSITGSVKMEIMPKLGLPLLFPTHTLSTLPGDVSNFTLKWEIDFAH
jgi:hypothetical protein